LFRKKIELFLKTLLTVGAVPAYKPLINEGGAPLAITLCALVKSIKRLSPQGVLVGWKPGSLGSALIQQLTIFHLKYWFFDN